MENIKNIAEFSDWEKLDLRVAEIKNVEEIQGADKLWKLTLDVGSEIGERIVCAGIKEFYGKEELIGKKIIYFSNLKPRVMRGVESQGMLLAASEPASGTPTAHPKSKNDNKEKRVVLISPEKDIENGAKIS